MPRWLQGLVDQPRWAFRIPSVASACVCRIIHLEGDPTAQVVFEFPPTVFSALRKSPEDFADEMRLAAAIHWYSQG
jgi:hypothetical protein